MNKLPGFYVEGKYFGNREAQACAYAQHRANEFGRALKVMVKPSRFGDEKLLKTMHPDKRAA